MKKKPKHPMKVATIFGTRPEIIRLACVMRKLDEYFDHVMVHTGQSYDYAMNKVFFDDLGLRKPDHFLDVKSDTLGGQIGNVIARSEAVLKKEMPAAVLILGDTNSALSAIVAKRMHIPIFHMEAGNRAFDVGVPEEVNRKIVDHISDINLPYSEHARMNLLREGIHPGTIFVTGTPLAEVFAAYRGGIARSKVLSKLKLSSRKYFVASIHREENVESDANLDELVTTLRAVADDHGLPVIVSTHPRTRKRLESRGVASSRLVRFNEPFGYFDYNRLQTQAYCVLSDSGSIHEESAIMGFPAVQMRVSAERPEAFDEGVAILSGRRTGDVLRAIAITVGERKKGIIPAVPAAYRVPDVSSKVAKLITGLTHTVAPRHLG